ncbi:hypothetical protein Pint_25447 [Pistacia integerrima]|uniref:Uncharacterized protein n=1 Tax=Pistacia integerrima TaxID=434235 RepID=A0ACC0YFQ7_9ROSI|nr:hypothetical protein Pint_25447 [Pistacia integerrima]
MPSEEGGIGGGGLFCFVEKFFSNSWRISETRKLALRIEVDELDAPEEENGRVHGAVEFLNKAKLSLKSNDSVYQALLNALNGNNKDVGDVYNDVAAILVGHHDLMEEFNTFVLSSEEGKKDSIKKKRKTSPDHDERDCKDCVNKVCRKVLSRKDRRKKSPHCDGADSKDFMNKAYRKGLAFFEKIKSSFGDSGEYLKFLEQIHEYNSKRIEICGVVPWLAKFPHLLAEFEQFLNECPNRSGIKEDKSVNVEHKRQKIGVERMKNNERYKCIEYLDFSNSETCTPSYWSMPEEYGVPKYNLQRSDLDGDVLNNQLICRNSRQVNFKTRNLSKYEKVLNKCEDNRYEADMMLHLLRSTAERIDILLNGENKLDFETLEIPFKIEEYLSVLYARCVERLYGGYDLEILNYNPKIGLPILLERLNQKIKECEEDLIELNKLMASV